MCRVSIDETGRAGVFHARLESVTRRNAKNYYRAPMTVLYDGGSMMPEQRAC